MSKGTYDDLSVDGEVEIRYLYEDPSRVEVYPGQLAGAGTVTRRIPVIQLKPTVVSGITSKRYTPATGSADVRS